MMGFYQRCLTHMGGMDERQVRGEVRGQRSERGQEARDKKQETLDDEALA